MKHNLLSQISERLFKLRDYLSDNIVKFPKYAIIKKLKKIFRSRTRIYETDIDSDQTVIVLIKEKKLYFV